MMCSFTITRLASATGRTHMVLVVVVSSSSLSLRNFSEWSITIFALHFIRLWSAHVYFVSCTIFFCFLSLSPFRLFALTRSYAHVILLPPAVFFIYTLRVRSTFCTENCAATIYSLYDVHIFTWMCMKSKYRWCPCSIFNFVCTDYTGCSICMACHSRHKLQRTTILRMHALLYNLFECNEFSFSWITRSAFYLLWANRTFTQTHERVNEWKSFIFLRRMGQKMLHQSISFSFFHWKYALPVVFGPSVYLCTSTCTSLSLYSLSSFPIVRRFFLLFLSQILGSIFTFPNLRMGGKV